MANRTRDPVRRAIRAVLFDFGRVISAQKPLSLFRRYETELGLAAGTINPIMFGRPVWQDALMGRNSLDEFWEEIGPELGLKTREEIDAFRRRYHGDETINAEVRSLIRRLHGHYKLAVLSNSPPGLARWLADWGLLELFDVVFCSGDEGVIKPDPRAFQMTLNRLNVRPEEAVFIDDTREHVEAAQALGLHGIVFTDANALADELSRVLDLPR